ncbi:hypothetical protein PROFUN_01618 [Planoprotostelium fungivorum]|uniref:Uncharacterized protein n=1 Tax=Planoprotostelium fungivorum TaxID=1890364 RepID=A0A2P6NTT8_9EUKA|nr:hypothetical protein PROFUN_01618 [Planoprotostelium fungivorum]
MSVFQHQFAIKSAKTPPARRSGAFHTQPLPSKTDERVKDRSERPDVSILRTPISVTRDEGKTSANLEYNLMTQEPIPSTSIEGEDESREAENDRSISPYRTLLRSHNSWSNPKRPRHSQRLIEATDLILPPHDTSLEITPANRSIVVVEEIDLTRDTSDIPRHDWSETSERFHWKTPPPPVRDFSRALSNGTNLSRNLAEALDLSMEEPISHDVVVSHESREEPESDAEEDDNDEGIEGNCPFLLPLFEHCREHIGLDDGTTRDILIRKKGKWDPSFEKLLMDHDHLLRVMNSLRGIYRTLCTISRKRKFCIRSLQRLLGQNPREDITREFFRMWKHNPMASINETHVKAKEAVERREKEREERAKWREEEMKRTLKERREKMKRQMEERKRKQEETERERERKKMREGGRREEIEIL